MRISETEIEGVKIFEPAMFEDPRGYFLEAFSIERYGKAGLGHDFVQDNLSLSRKDTLRGLHLQNPNPQGKLIMVLSGAVLDVVIDVRVGSPTFARHVSIVLDDQAHRQLWVPRGFAHGFLVLSEKAIFLYKCDALYDQGSEMSIRWNDPDIAISWPVEHPLLSGKDAAAPFLRDLIDRLPAYKD
jgi:dTDP-4-dehydrorhamnose 3,5-epimerase